MKNYYLIFSFSGRDQYANQVRLALKTDYPISVVFYDQLPKTFLETQITTFWKDLGISLFALILGD